MEAKEKIAQFYSSKGEKPEEYLEEVAEVFELEPEKMDFWWKNKVQVWRNTEVSPKEYKD